MRLIAVILILWANVSWAVTISSTSGTYTDGQSISVSGSGFGASEVIGTIQFLKTNIEAGTDNTDITLPTGWDQDTDGINFSTPHYSTDVARGGVSTKAIKAWRVGGSPAGSGFWYDFGVGGTAKLYASWYVYANAVSTVEGSIGQWKQVRITPGQGGGLHSDQRHSIYFPCQILDSQTAVVCSGVKMFMNFCCDNASPDYLCQSDGSTAGPPYACYDNVNQVPNPATNDPKVGQSAGVVLDNTWYRMEVFAKFSAADTLNGELIVKYTKMSVSTPADYINLSATMTRGTNSETWRYIDFQNFFGLMTEMYAYFTDVYVQDGTYQRLELCDNATWANRTHCEIQYPTAWADGAITFTLNRGSFGASDTVYLYAIDSAGNVSNAYTINLGGSSGGNVGLGTGPAGKAEGPGFKVE